MRDPFAAGGRRARPQPAHLVFLVITCAVLGQEALRAQALTVVSTSISPDGRGGVVATTVGADGPAYHPSHVLVRFRHGAPASFLPEACSTRAIRSVLFAMLCPVIRKGLFEPILSSSFRSLLMDPGPKCTRSMGR